MTQGEASVEAVEQPAIAADDDMVATASLGAPVLYTICDELDVTYAEAVSRALQAHALVIGRRR
jgi:hypothetical protein